MRAGTKAEALRDDRQLSARTDEDARIAALVADAAGVPHVVLEQPDRFDAERRKNLLTSFCSDEHAWALALADFLTGRAAAFDGLGGDVLSAGLFLTRRRQRLYERGRYASWPSCSSFREPTGRFPLFLRSRLGAREGAIIGRSDRWPTRANMPAPRTHRLVLL